MRLTLWLAVTVMSSCQILFKNHLRGRSLRVRLIPKIPYFDNWSLVHISKVTMVKFDAKVQTLDSLPKPNLIEK